MARAGAQNLWAQNTPAAFWRLLGEPPSSTDWAVAGRTAQACLASLAAGSYEDSVGLAAAILGEGQFGPRHWQLSPAKRLYYAVRPRLPAAVRQLLQRAVAHRSKAGGMLDWPVEGRYVRYLFDTARGLLESTGQDSLPYVHFWPEGHRYALVLTHDVESAAGQRFVGQVAALEERLGFRSSFNFVPEGYAVDRSLLAELRERGFEIGVHGLRHDGRLFSSRGVFRERARRINGYLGAWRAVGFRAPMTHRNPVWMQALEIEYDSSFFDTDPFEPIPGGTMSIWPYMMGRFVELPYTLAQDHTLLRTLGEATPRLWLDKVAYIRRHCGMALVNTHPDYLAAPHYLRTYEAFLMEVREQGGYWHALPRDAARWWRARAGAMPAWQGDRWLVPGLPQATIGQASLCSNRADGEALILDPRFRAQRPATERAAAWREHA